MTLWYCPIFLVLIFYAAHTDRKEGRIQNALVAAVIASFLLTCLIQRSMPGTEHLIGFFLPFVILFPVFCMKGIGAGDVKLLMAIGLAVGYHSVVVVMFVAFLLGVIQGFLTRTRKVHLASAISVAVLLDLVAEFGGLMPAM